MSKKPTAGKAILFCILCILCVAITFAGMILLAYGIAEPGKSHEVVGECYKCDGVGAILKNGIPITCPSCNGFGSSVVLEYDGEAYIGIGIVLMIVGIIGYILSFIQIKRNRWQRQCVPSEAKPLSPYAVQVKLYDTSYDSGSQCFATMPYTFTDADTREVLGKGTQNQIVTLNVDKPTRIKCQVRGFKAVVLNYNPRENAKYRVIPNIYSGIRFEETDSF